MALRRYQIRHLVGPASLPLNLPNHKKMKPYRPAVIVAQDFAALHVDPCARPAVEASAAQINQAFATTAHQLKKDAIEQAAWVIHHSGMSVVLRPAAVPA